MTKKHWLVILVVYEIAWLAYMMLLAPVAVNAFTRIPAAEMHASLLRLAYIVPIFGVITILVLCCAIYDIARREVSTKAVWILGFVLLAPLVLPLYFVVHVSRPAQETAS